MRCLRLYMKNANVIIRDSPKHHRSERPYSPFRSRSTNRLRAAPILCHATTLVRLSHILTKVNALFPPQYAYDNRKRIFPCNAPLPKRLRMELLFFSIQILQYYARIVPRSFHPFLNLIYRFTRILICNDK